MQSLAAAVEAVAGDEFDTGVRFILLRVSAYFQPQPLAGVIVQVEGGGAGERLAKTCVCISGFTVALWDTPERNKP